MRLVLLDRRFLAALLFLAMVGTVTALWAGGHFADLAAWARVQQREMQNALAGLLRSARQGETGVIAGLIGAAWLYGFVHAIGPGHGKFLIGGAGVASRATAWRMAGIGLAASLGQAVTAIALVYGGMALFALSARQFYDPFGGGRSGAEATLEMASHVAIGLVGLWLLWRGITSLRRWLAARRHALAHQGHHHGHHAHHAHHGSDCGCGHKHGATAEEAEALSGWRDTAALIGAIAIRPCTGAVILLVLAWQFDLIWIGIAGTVAMGVGTGLVVGGVALASVWFRETSLASAGGNGSGARLLAAVLQCGAGVLIAVFSAGMILA